MPFVLLLGGARSGKSALAVRLASGFSGSVVMVATAEGRDDEMRERIRRHREERPPDWRTVEEPVELVAAIGESPADACVIVDCLTLWTSNLLERGWEGDAIESEAHRVADTASSRSSPAILVSNEVGLGIVPATPLSRAYRDILGRVNAICAEAAEESLLVVAGRLVRLVPASGLGGFELP
ncbi:MAG: bifunctional adenosylcobinamide kinase/adenosylcobinamide-phosphate guanylyltransferase [Gaiellaceae bacterium]